MNQQPDLKYYPICLDVVGKNCLVVGGGNVGARKALTLARCGAYVTVISPLFSDKFAKNINITDTTIQCIKKNYDINDLNSIFLVIGATDNMQLNRRIAQDAHKRDILCNIADFPEGSSFVLPSIVQRGDLVITLSTSGNSPALAKKLRKDLELQFGQEYASFLNLMGRIRKMLLAENNSTEANALIFRELVNSNLLEKIASGDEAGIESILEQILGSHFKTKYFMDGCNFIS
ncbi:MAG: bifunctional precorrin-2 dehydrogenase/sirohydrochlorin ferrochelatase [Desulfamplus sp.]|nr:bifunctional precorrin-2 dehydrogenase/sirohydrochlorin ferrochelatase [Desulfamplus sp.]